MRDFRRQDPIFLLTVTYAGQSWRFASEAITVLDAAGTAHLHRGGLRDLVYQTSFALLAGPPDMDSVSFWVRLPADVADLVERGHDLGLATGELALVARGDLLEERIVLIVGALGDPVYGVPQDGSTGVAFTLSQNAWDDSTTLVPAASQAVTETTWPSLASAAEGAVYPTVLGSPGPYVRASGGSVKTSGSPVLVVDTTAETLLVAGHRCGAGGIRIYDTANETGASFTLQNTTDGLGQTVAVVDASGASAPWVFDEDTEYWAIWDGSATGARSPYRAGPLEGAGDVLRYLLDRTSQGCDEDRWTPLARALNRYRLAGYWDERINPWEWLVTNLLPLLPVSIVGSARGLHPILWDRDQEPAHHLEEGRDWWLDPPEVVVERGTVTEVTLAYALRARTGDHKRSLTLTGSTPTDSDQQYQTEASVAALVAAGGRVASLELATDLVYDDATAARILAAQMAVQGLPTRSLSGVLSPRWWDLPLGVEVSLSHVGLAMRRRRAVLVALAYSPAAVTGTWLLHQDPARDLRTT